LFASEIAAFIEAEADNVDLSEYIQPLAAAIERLSDITENIINSVKDDPNALGAASVEYLDLFGLVAYAYMWARMVKVAAPKADEDAFYDAKVKTGKFFFSRLLPKSLALAESIRSGSEDMMSFSASQF